MLRTRSSGKSKGCERGMTYNTIKNILPQFRFQGSYQGARELTSGNGTAPICWSIWKESPRLYTLQRINTYVFKNPHAVMNNIALVTNICARACGRTTSLPTGGCWS